MKISVREAETQLPDLVRRAKDGDDVILTEGVDAVQLVPVSVAKSTPEQKRALFSRVRAMAANAVPGPDAAHSQDFLYDEDGLPK